MKPSRSEFITVRGLQYHVREWGMRNPSKLFMLHGWMDVSASFQFVVDELKRDWHVIAPDWRGFGKSERSGADSYWFPDYLADLDAILAHYSPDQAVNLVGHSMGGNIAALYAGIRPHRVAKLANLEGFGVPVTQPEQAPARYARWLDELREPAVIQAYPTLDHVVARLQRNNPRLSRQRAVYLAQHWAQQNQAGEWEILGDPVHKRTNPVLYRIDESLACWKAIAAPVLWVEGEHSDIWRWISGKEGTRQEIERRRASIRTVQSCKVNNAGHMLHHDQPEQVADLLERFF